jgi:hypothetical protein
MRKATIKDYLDIPTALRQILKETVEEMTIEEDDEKDYFVVYANVPHKDSSVAYTYDVNIYCDEDNVWKGGVNLAVPNDDGTYEVGEMVGEFIPKVRTITSNRVLFDEELVLQMIATNDFGCWRVTSPILKANLWIHLMEKKGYLKEFYYPVDLFDKDSQECLSFVDDLCNSTDLFVKIP